MRGFLDGLVLVAASVVLRSNENQPRTRFRGSLLQLRSPPAGLQNAEDRQVSRQYADADRSGYGKAQNQRHEERNHSQPPLLNYSNQMLPAQLSSMRLLQSTCVDARR